MVVAVLTLDGIAACVINHMRLGLNHLLQIFLYLTDHGMLGLMI
jgi:hypothetical protein